MPSIFREQIGDLVVNEILPLSLMQAFQKLLEPQVRDALMLIFIETLYSALNGEEPLHKDEVIEEVVAKPDPKCKHLYETCGSLVLELIKLVPDTTVQYVFMKDKVKNMSAEAIGDAMMPHLSRWTLLRIHRCSDLQRFTRFTPVRMGSKAGARGPGAKKSFCAPDSKMELKPVKKFKFDFGGGTIDREMQDNLKKDEAEKLRNRLLEGFTATISQQLHAKAWAFLKNIWQGLQQQIDDFIEGFFPDHGPEIKAIADQVFRKIFFDIFGVAIQFMAAPFIAAMKYIVIGL